MSGFFQRIGMHLLPLLAMLSVPGIPAAHDISPQELVRETSTRMLAAMQAEREVIQVDVARLYALVSEIVLPYFDFQRMSQWALGRNWRMATPDQQERFVNEFRFLLVRTYGTALLQYSDEEIIYLPFSLMPDADKVTVRTEIEPKGSAALPIYYSMYLTDDGWKVYDVAISGVSLVTNYRSTFASTIRRDGMEGLIRALTQNNQGAING